ncbi:VOC family protein [Thalassotalea maritima]|uniref:VOC family protein n=1 Tax=Thalassotalea maritima TaxID=3242416 RepID=UPI003529A849
MNKSAMIGSVLTDYIVGLGHIGYVVNDIIDAIETYQRVYALDERDIVVFPELSVRDTATRFAFITINDVQIELIQALKPPFTELLGQALCGGGGINHLAWQVTDIEACLAILAEQNIVPGYVTPNGVVDTGTKKMVYLDPNCIDGHYIELIEVKLTGVKAEPSG